MSGKSRLVLVGDSAIAQIAFEYFTHDSPYEVVGFAVERAYLTGDTLFDRPIIPFEEVTTVFPPSEHVMFVALGYNNLNRLRTRLYQAGKRLGYRFPSYVSSHAFVWRNVSIGENCFIFENNVVQPFVQIGNNVTMWSGNHIGHHSTIRDNVFFASHVVLSGFCDVGENCFLGVNATIANNVTIAKDCLVGASAVILRNTGENQIFGAKMTPAAEKTARAHFGVTEE